MKASICKNQESCKQIGLFFLEQFSLLNCGTFGGRTT